MSLVQIPELLKENKVDAGEEGNNNKKRDLVEVSSSGGDGDTITNAELTWRQKLLCWLQIYAFFDFLSSIMFLIEIVLSITSTWPLFSKYYPDWMSTREYLSDSWISAMVADPTEESTFLESPEMYWAMAIKLAIMNYYLYRLAATFDLVRAVMSRNVPLNLRLKYAKFWFIFTVILVIVNSIGLVFKTTGIPTHDSFRLSLEIFGHCLALYYVQDFFQLNRRMGKQALDKSGGIPLKIIYGSEELLSVKIVDRRRYSFY